MHSRRIRTSAVGGIAGVRRYARQWRGSADSGPSRAPALRAGLNRPERSPPIHARATGRAAPPPPGEFPPGRLFPGMSMPSPHERKFGAAPIENIFLTIIIIVCVLAVATGLIVRFTTLLG
jgi:hypothetical protein